MPVYVAHPMAGVQVMTMLADAATLGNLLPLALDVHFAEWLATELTHGDDSHGHALSDCWTAHRNTFLVWLIYHPVDGLQPDQVDAFLTEHNVAADQRWRTTVIAYNDERQAVHSQLWYNLEHKHAWRNGLCFDALTRKS